MDEASGSLEDDAKSRLFNYDEDSHGDSQTTDAEETLSWRLDRNKSLSDWTLKVVNMENTKPIFFYVHKNILAVGPRRGEYFVQNFRKASALDMGSVNHTEVRLEPVAAKCVPQLLDFMYSSDGALHIDTESATGLRHLAQFFGIRILHKYVMDFIVDDLSMSNLLVYYKDAVILGDERILDMTANHCAANILLVREDDDILSTIDPHFFRRVMASAEINSDEKKYHISTLLAKYCDINREYLDDTDFKKLTDEKYLPVVHYNASFTLMEMEADLVLKEESQYITEITSLQQRCITDLKDNWKEFCALNPDWTSSVFVKLSSTFLTDLMLKTLREASARVDETEENMDNVKKQAKQSAINTVAADLKEKQTLEAAKLKKEYEAKISKLKRDFADEREARQKDYDANVVKLRDLCVEKDDYIRKYWDELKRFERMPNQPDGKVAQSGSHTPTLMPTIGTHSQEGLILVNKKRGTKLPLFYYKDS